jgi:hypothetical protein
VFLGNVTSNLKTGAEIPPIVGNHLQDYAVYYLDLSIVFMFCNHKVSRDGSSLVIR